MHINLQRFLMRLAQERGLIRGKDKGPSIVPLAIVHFEDPTEESEYFLPLIGTFLATVSQQTSAVFLNRNLSKSYSAGSGLYGDYEVLGVSNVGLVEKRDIIRVRAKYIQIPLEPFNWD